MDPEMELLMQQLERRRPASPVGQEAADYKRAASTVDYLRRLRNRARTDMSADTFARQLQNPAAPPSRDNPQNYSADISAMEPERDARGNAIPGTSPAIVPHRTSGDDFQSYRDAYGIATRPEVRAYDEERRRRAAETYRRMAEQDPDTAEMRRALRIGQ